MVRKARQSNSGNAGTRKSFAVGTELAHPVPNLSSVKGRLIAGGQIGPFRQQLPALGVEFAAGLQEARLQSLGGVLGAGSGAQFIECRLEVLNPRRPIRLGGDPVPLTSQRIGDFGQVAGPRRRDEAHAGEQIVRTVTGRRRQSGVRAGQSVTDNRVETVEPGSANRLATVGRTGAGAWRGSERALWKARRTAKSASSAPG